MNISIYTVVHPLYCADLTECEANNDTSHDGKFCVSVRLVVMHGMNYCTICVYFVSSYLTLRKQS